MHFRICFFAICFCFAKGAALTLKVAMLCPLDEADIKSTAQDNFNGWDLWLKATSGKVALQDKTEVTINSTTIRFAEGTLDDRMGELENLDDKDKYHLVIGCSTYMMPKILEKMTSAKLPYVTCSGGNPDVWKAATWGYTMHAPFTNYPTMFFQMVKEKWKDTTKEKVKEKPKVMFVQAGKGHFEEALCKAALQAAKDADLALDHDGEMHNVDDITKDHMVDLEVLYVCSMGKDGFDAMQKLIAVPYMVVPESVSISVAPGLPDFESTFKKRAAYISMPAQWHYSAANECTDSVCPSVFSSNKDYVAFSEKEYKRKPSYEQAACSAVGVALEAAVKTLDSSFTGTSDKLAEDRTSLNDALGKVKQTSFWGKTDLTERIGGHESVILQYQPRQKGMQDVDLDKDDSPDPNLEFRAVTAKTFILKHQDSDLPEVGSSGHSNIGLIVGIITILGVLAVAGLLIKWQYIDAPKATDGESLVGNASRQSEMELAERSA